MRIIAGEARRTVLEVAPGTSTRPFLELARGALFNSLGHRVIGASVMDLYAGSGSMGLEALSRGAAACLFVESDNRAFAMLRRNIAKCGMEKKSRAMRDRVESALEQIDGLFDLVFVDPPFADNTAWRPDGEAGPVMRLIAERTGPDGIVILRLEEKAMEPPEWSGMTLESDRRYGRSRVCRYRKGSQHG